MKTSKFNKKNIILIIWGFLFAIIVIVLLSMLLLALKPQTPKIETNQVQDQNQDTNKKLKNNQEQEQETYNSIINTINKEVEKLTTEEEIVYHPASKTIKHIKIFDSTTKKEIKRINYILDDGKTVKQIWEINPEGTVIKSTHYDEDGKTIKWIKEINSEQKPTKITYYNSDGTVKEVRNL